MAKSVTLADIGKKLNVSTVTVSKALSGQKGVSEELRQQIHDLAGEMGYIKVKKTEVRDKSYLIGVIVAERFLQENQSFYWQIYQELSQHAILNHCFTTLEVVSYEAEMKQELPRIIVENKVEGMIIMGAFKNQYASMLVQRTQVALLTLDATNAGEGCDAVVSNNMMGGYQMTNYLFELGHKKIGFVGTRLATTSIDDRYFGYLKSMMEHGVPWQAAWVLDDRDREYGKVDYQNKFSLPQTDMPTAFFCNCDLSASLLIKKLTDIGYSVPEDISVVGFDNYIFDQLATIGITTYEIDIKEMARRAVHVILDKLADAGYSAGMFMLAGRFIERESARRVGPAVPFV